MRFGNLELDFSVVGEVEPFEPAGELEEGEVVIGEVPEELRKLFSLVVVLNQKLEKNVAEGMTVALDSMGFLHQHILRKEESTLEYLKGATKKLESFSLEFKELEFKCKVFSKLFWLALRSHFNLAITEASSDGLRFIKDWKVVIAAPEEVV